MECAMVGKLLHHVSLVSRNIEASAAFYRDVLELAEVKRPDFPIAGRWFRSGGVEVHLIDKSDGTFRQVKSIDHNDIHFAIRVVDFENEIARLKQLGFVEESDKGGEKQLRINRHGKAGYPQVYILDPDNHVIEINAEKL
jgi:glyoxylase I family protein